ncbi:MAG: PEP-CTERM sorting domain-containing protein [Proteobacteria bacterium]|nr:PEP-CTERM sorting domain-containing protein [Pseudomonadota bacterium]
MSRLGGQAVYDTDRNITWLADANYAQTSGYDNDGLMNWNAANAWATSLNIGGYTGWRLPTTLQPDTSCSGQFPASYGYNCTGSELGHLFYSELGGVANQLILFTHNSNFDLFTNVQSAAYWSGTVYAPNPLTTWGFTTWDGNQSYGYFKDYSFSYQSWAVRSGDVDGGVGTVPEPGMIWLFGAGVLAWSGSRTRRRG